MEFLTLAIPAFATLIFSVGLMCGCVCVYVCRSDVFLPRPSYESPCFSSIHACVFMKTLVHRFVEQQQCPANMQDNDNAHGAIYGLTSSVACMSLAVHVDIAAMKEMHNAIRNIIGSYHGRMQMYHSCNNCC